MLTVFGGLAEFERHLIKQRTSEGRENAKRNRVHMGRPHKLDPDQRREALARRARGDRHADIARTFAVDRSTISRMR